MLLTITNIKMLNTTRIEYNQKPELNNAGSPKERNKFLKGLKDYF